MRPHLLGGLAAIALGAALRLLPLLAGGPVPHPDEFNATYWPLLVAMGDPAPRIFYYPYLHYYLLGALHLLQGMAATAFTDEPLSAWLGIRFFWAHAEALDAARWLNALCACITVGLTGGLARTVYGGRAGFVAALLAAVSLLFVRQSPVAGLDVPMAMWFTASVWAAVRLVDRDGAGAYGLAGALVGVAAATKYHGALAAPAVAAAHLLAGRRIADGRLLLAGVAAVAAYLAGSPYTLLRAPEFLAGFGNVVEHVSTGLGDLGPGWIHHVTTSLRHNLGWAGLTVAAVGGVAMIRAGPKPRTVVAAFLGYYLVIGASPLVFVRYALPLAALQCVLAAAGIEWLLARFHRRQVPALALSLTVVAVPALWVCVRAADLLATPDTRREAADWIERSVPQGATLCNFGSWSGDTPLETAAGVWWRARHYVAHAGLDGLEDLLPHLEDAGPVRPVYYHALQGGWLRQYEAGSERAVEEFECDWIVLNRHPLTPVRVDSTFAAALPAIAQVEATFEPDGWPDAEPVYDPIDAFFVPLGGFGSLRQPGPKVEVWRVHGARPVDPAPWAASQLLARSFLRGGLAMLEEGRDADFRRLDDEARRLSPTALDADYHRRIGWVYRRRGEPAQTERWWRRSLELDPENHRLWLELGLLYAGDPERYEDAAGCFERVLAIDPEHPKSGLLRAFIGRGQP